LFFIDSSATVRAARDADADARGVLLTPRASAATPRVFLASPRGSRAAFPCLLDAPRSGVDSSSARARTAAAAAGRPTATIATSASVDCCVFEAASRGAATSLDDAPRSAHTVLSVPETMSAFTASAVAPAPARAHAALSSRRASVASRVATMPPRSSARAGRRANARVVAKAGPSGEVEKARPTHPSRARSV